MYIPWDLNSRKSIVHSRAASPGSEMFRNISAAEQVQETLWFSGNLRFQPETAGPESQPFWSWMCFLTQVVLTAAQNLVQLFFYIYIFYFSSPPSPCWLISLGGGGVFLGSYLGEMQRSFFTLLLPSQISVAFLRGTYRHHSQDHHLVLLLFRGCKISGFWESHSIDTGWSSFICPAHSKGSFWGTTSPKSEILEK